MKLLRLYGVRADGLDGRLLAARISSKDDGVSLAESENATSLPVKPPNYWSCFVEVHLSRCQFNKDVNFV